MLYEVITLEQYLLVLPEYLHQPREAALELAPPEHRYHVLVAHRVQESYNFV